MSSSTTELLPNGVGRVPAWWMDCTPHYTLDVDDEEARQIAEDQVAFFYMMLAAADDAGFIGPDGKPKIGPDGKPLNWEGLGPNWNSGSSGLQFGGRTFKPGQAVIDPSLFGIKESDPNYNAYLTGAKLPPGYFEKMAELVKERNSDGNPYGILNNSKQTDFGRYGRQAERQAFQPSWAKKKLRSTTQGQAVRSGKYDDSPNKFLDINGRQRRVQAKEYTNDEAMVPDEPVVSTQPESAMASVSSPPAPKKNIPVSNILPSTPIAPQPVETVVTPAAPPSPPSPQPQRRASVTMSRKVRRVVILDEPVDSMITNNKALLKSREEAIAAAADDEERLQELLAQKERLLHQQKRMAEEKAAEERLQEQRQQEELAKQMAAAEARKRQLEKMQQLQMQAAAEEAEAERKRQEAALALKQQKEAELQRLREQQAQHQPKSQSTVAESAPMDPSIAEKLRRLEELKELKRQQELAEAQAATETNEEYEEETFIEEEVVEEEITVGDDEEYSLEEETYVEDTSITDLQAILAAKQAELARLQGS